MIRRLLAAFVVVAVASILVPTTLASAGEGPELDADLLRETQPLSFQLRVLDADCDDASLTLDGVEDEGGNPITPVSFTIDPTEPNNGVAVLPDDTEPGVLLFQVSCTEESDPVEVEDTQGFAALEISKVIDGNAPPGVSFVIEVDCVEVGEGSVAADLSPDFIVEFDGITAAGFVGYVYTDGIYTCTITEPQNGGALSTVITPAEVITARPDPYAVTVTNTFPTPVVVTPAFTG